MSFSRNNLDRSASPYLQQHSGNPVWWQEWNQETLAYAREQRKILFVSVGYATCHWCHVMAQEAFCDQAIADILNKHFVSIKVDREQRPDIDQYMMAIIQSMSGQGGWPLNVFLSPGLEPIYALTYAPVQPSFGMSSFLNILEKVRDFYEANRDQLASVTMSAPGVATAPREALIDKLWEGYDPDGKGFGKTNKFPMHATLLFLVYYLASHRDAKAKTMLEATCDQMSTRGLHDHLQGGFFRYCVDRYWTIPHFEKMLYDQALALWVYSAAYKVLAKREYRIVAEKIVRCLEETFEENGLFISALDADTDHKEGATYLWSYQELKEALALRQFEAFAGLYDISASGNFEGSNHLVKKRPESLSEAEEALLGIRKKRPQPFVDRKIVTSWNCWAGVAFVCASRALGKPELLTKAEKLCEALLSKHCDKGQLYHSSCAGAVQRNVFLEDHAAFLLLLTYLYEETGRDRERLKEFYDKIKRFRREDVWVESANPDFREVPASTFDLPIPSSSAAAELALLRTAILLGEPYAAASFCEPHAHDFRNLTALVSNGFFHIIETPQKLAWEKLPLNAIQKKGDALTDCYEGSCRPGLDF